MLSGIFAGTVCFFLFLSHIYFFHVFKIRRRFRFMAALFLSILAFYIILYAFFSNIPDQGPVFFMPLGAFAFLNGLFLHFAAGYLYLHCLQVIDRSPSCRMMIEIAAAPERNLSLEEIKQRYSIDKKVADKVEEMSVLGCIRREDGRYFLTARGKKYMHIGKGIRDYLKLERN